MKFFRVNHSLGIFFAALVMGCAGSQVAPGSSPGASGNQLGSGNNAVGITMDSGVPTNVTENNDKILYIQVLSSREKFGSPDAEEGTVKVSGLVKCAAEDGSLACPANRLLRLVTCGKTRYVETRLGPTGSEGNSFEITFDTQCLKSESEFSLARKEDYLPSALGAEKDCPVEDNCGRDAKDWVFTKKIYSGEELPEPIGGKTDLNIPPQPIQDIKTPAAEPSAGTPSFQLTTPVKVLLPQD